MLQAHLCPMIDVVCIPRSDNVDVHWTYYTWIAVVDVYRLLQSLTHRLKTTVNSTLLQLITPLRLPIQHVAVINPPNPINMCTEVAPLRVLCLLLSSNTGLTQSYQCAYTVSRCYQHRLDSHLDVRYETPPYLRSHFKDIHSTCVLSITGIMKEPYHVSC